jgi:hypothetical protein
VTGCTDANRVVAGAAGKKKRYLEIIAGNRAEGNCRGI